MRPQSGERAGCGLQAALQQLKNTWAECTCAGVAHKHFSHSLLRGFFVPKVVEMCPVDMGQFEGSSCSQTHETKRTAGKH